MITPAFGWIGLNLVEGIGPARAHRLAQACGSPEKVFAMSLAELMEQGKIGTEVAGRIKALDWPCRVEEELSRCRLVNCRILTLADEAYPALLRQISIPPPVIYLRGNLTPEDEKSLSIVGCRKPSMYGKEAALQFARSLAEVGFTVVSGLARGIDAQAHQGALDSGGRTIAVLAHGLDRVYPEEHRDLHDLIVKSGAVISEFPLGTSPMKENFPRRNRLISGLSLGVLVVEAGVKSGALITARWAAEQGREVFAVPGKYDSPTSQGTHGLIQDGAKLVMNLRDILEEFSLAHEEGGLIATGVGLESRLPVLTQEQLKIYHALHAGACHVDQLAAECGQPVSKLLSELLRLELDGWVQPTPGGFYTWNEN
jgi:DNA processing protein